MQLRLPSFPLWSTLALALSFPFLSCDKDLTSSSDQPTVNYVLLVTDSTTSTPLANVKIRVTSISGDTATYFTSSSEGRVEVATLASSRTLFELSKSGYRTKDLLDTVNAKPDSVFNRPIQRLLSVKMVSLDPGAGRVQAQLQLRTEDLQRLRKGRVTFTDSLGNEKVASDNDTDGTIELAGLPEGSSWVRVEHANQLGRRIEVKVAKGDSGKAAATTVILLDLDNSITGQVLAKTATSSKALLDAKVEFHLKDSLALPRVFRTFTSADAGQNGRFALNNVPALAGELWFFKDRTSPERVKALPVTQEEVMMEGALPLVTLTIAADSLAPLLVSGPGKSLPANDSVGAKDTLVFKFNQAVEALGEVKVRLINESELLAATSLSSDKTVLKVWQKESDWREGKRYEYHLNPTNAIGEDFTIPGDSTRGIKGTFVVKTTPAGKDSTLRFPREIRFAYFNSGNHFQFGPADTATSPKADSTSQFGRVKMRWDTGAGPRVDSLLLFYKDGRTAADWTLWGSAPGFLDSINVSFSDHYSTLLVPSQLPRFPLRDSAGEIAFRVIPKHKGVRLDAEDTTLEALSQGMGPTVYAHYSKDSLKAAANDEDTLDVWFGPKREDPTVIKAWGAANVRPTPKIYMNDKVVDTTSLKWRWTDAEGKKGRLIYRLPGVITAQPELRVDLNGVPYLGKPIWMRNPGDRKALPK